MFPGNPVKHEQKDCQPMSYNQGRFKQRPEEWLIYILFKFS